MTLLYLPQLRLYLGWQAPEFYGWWLDTRDGFRCHLGRLELVVG